MKPSDYYLMIAMAILWFLVLGDYFYFRHQGARFTATDGQTLCERVKALDNQPCHFNKK